MLVIHTTYYVLTGVHAIHLVIYDMNIMAQHSSVCVSPYDDCVIYCSTVLSEAIPSWHSRFLLSFQQYYQHCVEY